MELPRFLMLSLAESAHSGEADAGLASDGPGGWIVGAFLLLLIFAPAAFVVWAKPLTRLVDRVSVGKPQNPWSKPPAAQVYSTGEVAAWLPDEAETEDGMPSGQAPWHSWSGHSDPTVAARARIRRFASDATPREAAQERFDAVDRLISQGVIDGKRAEARRARIAERYGVPRKASAWIL
jgi:hypothetical protein